MDPMTWSFWQHLGMAVLCGAILGVERELHDKPAGVRTCVFVCLGSMLFVRLGSLMDGPGVDPTRVLGQVITGVGFIGAGVILGGGGAVKGVTTAAVIWLLAAIGALVATDQMAGALAASVASVVMLIVLDKLANRIVSTVDEPDV